MARALSDYQQNTLRFMLRRDGPVWNSLVTSIVCGGDSTTLNSLVRRGLVSTRDGRMYRLTNDGIRLAEQL